MRAPRKGPQRPLPPEEHERLVREAGERKRGQGKHKATAKDGVEQMTTRIKKIRHMLDTEELSPSARRTSEAIISILEAQIAKEEAARTTEVVE